MSLKLLVILFITFYVNAVFLKLTRVYILYRHAKNLCHASPQNRFTLKEFETTIREIGLIIFHRVHN